MRKAQKEAYTTHGMTGSPEYETWLGMRRRCYNPNRSDYARYGGRGITVSQEWKNSFEEFYRDMGPRPKDHSLERIDNSKEYCKDNCVWASRVR